MATLMEKDVILELRAHASAELINTKIILEKKGITEHNKKLQDLDRFIAKKDNFYLMSKPEELDFELEAQTLKSIIDMLEITKQALSKAA